MSRNNPYTKKWMAIIKKAYRLKVHFVERDNGDITLCGLKSCKRADVIGSDMWTIGHRCKRCRKIYEAAKNR